MRISGIRGGVALAMVASTLALEATSAASPPRAGAARGGFFMQPQTAMQAKKPFTIRAGKVYYVHARLSHVGAHQRIAVESYVHGRWYFRGSYRLHRGQRVLNGKATTSVVGFYTLRLHFMRNGKLIKGNVSNKFKVRVTGLKKPRTRRPRTNAQAPRPNAITYGGWNDILCARPALQVLGRRAAVELSSPVSHVAQQDTWLNQVWWARDAYPGGTYGAWHIVATKMQHVLRNDPSVVSIEGVAAVVTSNYLSGPNLYYRTDETLVHQYAWDLQIFAPGIGWSYINNTDFYTPESYGQYAADGTGPYSRPDCITFAS